MESQAETRTRVAQALRDQGFVAGSMAWNLLLDIVYNRVRAAIDAGRNPGSYSATQAEVQQAETGASGIGPPAPFVPYQPQPIQPIIVPQPPIQTAPPGGGGGAIVRYPVPVGGSNLPALLSRLLPYLPSLVVRLIREAGGRWSAIPGWIRTILITLGVTEGADIILDDEGGGGGGGGGGNLPALPGMGTFPATSSGAMIEPQHGLVVGQWMANGTPFVRFADGWQAAYSVKKGRWKYWKPKVPIILYTDGARTPQQAAKAFKALKRQAKALKPMVDQFTGTRTRRRAVQETHAPDGSVTIIKS